VKKIVSAFILCLIALPSLADQLPTTPTGFWNAKKIVYKIWKDSGEGTVYCGCDFNANSRLISKKGCGYKPKMYLTRRGTINQRARRIEAEHITTAHSMGIKREWSSKFLCKNRSGRSFRGRKCGYKLDPYFKRAHNDLYNLAPAIGELNADRSNKPFGVAGFGAGLKLSATTSKRGAYGSCDFETTRSIADPGESVRGELARAELYMMDTWGSVLGFYFPKTSDRKQIKHRLTLLEWDRKDPPTKAEFYRNTQIAKIQGKSNPYIDAHIK